MQIDRYFIEIRWHKFSCDTLIEGITLICFDFLLANRLVVRPTCILIAITQCAIVCNQINYIFNNGAFGDAFNAKYMLK